MEGYIVLDVVMLTKDGGYVMSKAYDHREVTE